MCGFDFGLRVKTKKVSWRIFACLREAYYVSVGFFENHLLVLHRTRTNTNSEPPDSCANASRVQYVVRAALSRAHYYRGFSRVFIPVVHVLPNSRQDLLKKRSSGAFSHLSHWFVVTKAIFRFSFPTASPVQQPCIINHLFKAPGCGIISPLFAAFCKKYWLTLHMSIGLGGRKRPLVERCISALCEVTGLTQSCTCFNMLLVAKKCFFRKTDKSKGLNQGLFLFLCWEQYHRCKTLVKRILHNAGRLKNGLTGLQLLPRAEGLLAAEQSTYCLYLRSCWRKGNLQQNIFQPWELFSGNHGGVQRPFSTV